MLARRKLTRLLLALLVLCAFGSGPLTATTQAPRVKVGGDIEEPRKIKHVDPVYPEDAKAAKVQGLVFLDIVVAIDGRVLEIVVRRSIPALDAAAVAAVSQWEYARTFVKGEPVEVTMPVVVNFNLRNPQ
jgi:protein TonB